MADILVWLYNSRTGAVVQNLKPIAEVSLSSGLGWHGPFGSKDDALTYYTANKDKNPGWKPPTGLLGTIGNIPDSIGSAVDDTIQSKLGLTDDNIRSWMIRIGEILLGIVLVGVGVAKLTGSTNAVAKLVKARI